MRKASLAAALAPVCLALMAAAPEPAKPIDLQKYSGRWYEVARLHNKIEEECVNAQVTYNTIR